MRKRIFSVILILSLVLSINAVGISAQETESVKNIEHKKELVDILTGGYEFDDEHETVSRSEFLTLLLSSTGIDYSGKTDREIFTDVSADSELSGIVNAAVERGMVSHGSKFYPDEPITYIQAVKMAVSFIDYAIQAETSGGYPQGYANTAFRVGILDDVSYSEAKSIDVSDAYTMVYNTVHVLMPEINEKGEIVSYTSDKCENVLSKYHGIYSVEGVVTADKKTSLYNTNKSTGEEYIRIGNEEYFCSANEDLLGLNVTAYYKNDKHSAYGDNEIIMIYPTDNEVCSIISEDFASIDSGYLKYYSGAKTLKIKVSDNIRVIKNGTVNYPDNMNEFFGTPNGVFEFIDNDMNGTYDVVKAKIYKYVHVQSVDSVNGYIFDRNGSENTLDLSDSACEYEIYEEYYNGMVKIELDEIEKNSLIAYTQTEDKQYCSATILNSYESGTISSVNDDEVVINGVTHTINDYAKKYFNFKSGDDGVFYFGIDGSLVSYVKGGSEIQYGWVCSAWVDDADDDICWVKLFADDDTMHRAKLTKKPILDGVRTTAKGAYDRLKTLIASNDIDRMIRFKTNKDDEINMIDTGENVSTIGDGFKTLEDNNSLRIFYREKSGLQYKASNGIFGRKVKIDSSTAIFAIPSESERSVDSNFGMLKPSYFPDDDKTQTITAYDINADTGLAGALMIKASAAGDEPSYWPEGIGVIEKKLHAINEDNELCYLFTIWKYDGTYEQLYSTDFVKDEAEKAGIGDIIRYEADNKHQIKLLAVDYDLSEGEIYRVGNSDCEYQKGYIYSYDSGIITLLQNDIDISDTNAINNVSINDLFVTTVTKILIVNVKERDGKIVSTEVLNTPDGNVRTIRTAGDRADTTVIRGRYWTGLVSVIYRYE